MKLELAKTIANRLRERMSPFCERIEIAGSVRRQKDKVNDIEIVAIPKLHDVKVRKEQVGLFEEEYEFVRRSQLVDECLVKLPNTIWLKPGYKEMNYYIQKHKRNVAEKVPDILLDIQLELSAAKSYGTERLHWKGLTFYKELPVKIDLFLTARDRFGATYLLRTGSAEFNMALVQILRNYRYGFKDGNFVKFAYDGSVAGIEYCPDELTIFHKLGYQEGIPAPQRNGDYFN